MSNNITAPGVGSVLATIEIGGVHYPVNILADAVGGEILGRLTANPDALSIAGRLKTIAENTDGLEALATLLNTYADGLEALIAATNAALATLGQPSSAAGGAIVPVVTGAAANGLVGKAAAGNLYGFTGHSTLDGWFLVVDAAAIPGNGAVVPLDFFPYAADSALAVDYSGAPLRCATGIAILFSTTGPYAFTGSATASISAKVK